MVRSYRAHLIPEDGLDNALLEAIDRGIEATAADGAAEGRGFVSTIITRGA